MTTHNFNSRNSIRPWQRLVGAGLFATWTMVALAAPASGSPPAGLDTFRNLDAQVSDIKRQALEINRDLLIIEEESFIPPSAQLAVFVALAKKSPPRMRQLNVKLEVDGTIVAHHLYESADIEALFRGGMQRLYLGSLAVGPHSLMVEVEGRTSAGESLFVQRSALDFSKAWDRKFLSVSVELSEKETKPKLVFTDL
jgi:hypothetical protein